MVKIGTCPPSDEKEDYALDVWAGVLPVINGYGIPVPDNLLKEGISVSESIKHARGI
ncbi:MAG: hypothetical protein IIB82_08715 [Bacteroidetes bacterium]|nr:hypothetical protein [Bacteroidota bacterium]